MNRNTRHMSRATTPISKRCKSSAAITVSDAEDLALDAGLDNVRSVTSKERFDYKDGKEFFESPLIETFFLNDWLAILPDEETRRQVRQQLMEIIDEERYEMDFDVSIKAALIIGQK